MKEFLALMVCVICGLCMMYISGVFESRKPKKIPVTKLKKKKRRAMPAGRHPIQTYQRPPEQEVVYMDGKMYQRIK